MGKEVTPDYFTDMKEKGNKLLANIQTKLPELETLLEEVSSHWGYEDPIYRFYHHSFKVYGLQHVTRRIVDVLKGLAPEGRSLCKEFEEIIKEGAGGKEFEHGHNEKWTHHTRPFVEAFFHAKYFLEMVVKYGKEMEEPLEILPSGWAAVLCLYDVR
ncbi:MAG: hypothetical protein JRC68_04205 [Deltaproteobacteria bacterium]|nr:hypothetical protein [Deltaproteobacteria bacterium]